MRTQTYAKTKTLSLVGYTEPGEEPICTDCDRHNQKLPTPSPEQKELREKVSSVMIQLAKKYGFMEYDKIVNELLDLIIQAKLSGIKEERERCLTIAKGYILNQPVGAKRTVVPEKLYRELIDLQGQFDETDKLLDQKES